MKGYKRKEDKENKRETVEKYSRKQNYRRKI